MDIETAAIKVDKIVEKSRQWTLEGDCNLLQWMNQISKNLEERVTKTSSGLNELTIKLDRTSVALSNATNNLACLQYSRFVENRVHDDDETLANVAEVPSLSTDVTDNTAVKKDMYTFLKKNLEMMNSCHEAFYITYNDSDDDEPATNVVYRSTNPYETRPLPHIYGSDLWKEKWHIGLCDSDNDFSGDENSEQFSESSSTADDSYESTAPTMSEWDSTAWGLNTNHIADRKEIQTSSNDGESSNQGENSSHMDAPMPKAKVNQPIMNLVPDQRYYQHVPRKEENLFDDIFTEVERPVAAPQDTPPAKIPVIQASLIVNEPPPIDQPIESENNRLVGAKKPLNLFDDDEFSSFMDQIVQTATIKNVKSSNPPEAKIEQTPKKIVPNIFDESEDLFTPKAGEPPAAEVKRKEAPPKLEDDIFMPPPLPIVAEKARTRNLFDDDDEEDDFESIFAKKPSKSSKFTQNTKNLFDDDLGDLPVETESESLALESEKQNLDAKKVLPVKESAVQAVQSISKVLFDDDDEDLETEEDNLFNKPVKKNLFEDLSITDETVNEKTADAKKNLFSNEEENKESKSEAVAEKTEHSSTTSVLRTSIFTDPFREEPPDDDIFATDLTKKNTKIADIFSEDFTDDFDEFIPKSPKSHLQDAFPGCEETLTDTNQVDPERSNEEIKHHVEEDSKPMETTQSEKPQKDMTVDAIGPERMKEADSTKSTFVQQQKEHLDAVSEEVQPPITVPNYTSLFNDEPPPDDEDRITGRYEETVQYSKEENATISTPPVAPYSSINLFADVPPDDDFQIAPPLETKRIHSIFYDDFNETIEASREMRAPSTYIFNEEPPPDDEVPIPSENLEEKSKVFEEKKDKPKVSKLKKMDLQINVGALLPTAKIPIFKKTESVSVQRKVENHSVETPVAKSPEKRDLPENVLPNLNRDRPKMQVKRRPSTRKGRHESYRKSIIEDEGATLYHDKSDDENSKNPTSENIKDTERYKSEVPSRKEFFDTTSRVIPLPKRAALFEESVEQIFSAETKPSAIPSLLADSETNIFEALRSDKKRPSEIISQITPVAKVLDSIFASVDDDEDPFDLSSNAFHKPTRVEPIKAKSKTEIPPDPAPTVAASLFDDGDDVVASPSKTAFNVPKEQPKKSSKPVSLFGESDDGSDDLFNEIKIPKKSAPQKTVEKKTFKPKAVDKPIKPSGSLFSSDEESGSGDDIFGKPKSKVVTKKVVPVKSKQTASLFENSTDDEADDLFETSKKKPLGVDRSKMKPSSSGPQSTKISALKPQQTGISNNPLADLLDP